MNEKFSNKFSTNTTEMLLKKEEQRSTPTHARCHGTTTGGGINKIIILEIMQIMSHHRKFQNFVRIFTAKIFIIPSCATEFYAKNYIEEVLLAMKHIFSLNSLKFTESRSHCVCDEKFN